MTSLNRSQFDSTCKAFVGKYSDLHDALATDRGLTGWSWNEHSSMAGFGYLSRTVTLSAEQLDSLRNGSILVAEDVEVGSDEATLPSLLSPSTLTSKQYVVYSATFQVPAFYFTIYQSSNGSPLALADIVKSRLFRQFALEGTESTPFGVSTPASLFPLLSQGDHPTLGTPCWYFHPCETPAAVSEVMKEFVQDDWTDGQRLLRWMEVWFMILGTAVDLNA